MLITAVLSAASTRAKPRKVFILAGQSNMEGHAGIGTFDYIGDAPPRATAQANARN
jgi:alpha-galactosidase